MKFELLSAAFHEGELVPVRHTGEGDDDSPALNWQGSPQATRGFALICDDPDAPTPDPWVHWLIYNLPPDIQSLPEKLPKSETVVTPLAASQGKTSWPDGQNIGYRGPMPPPGHGVHHYHFKLFALDEALQLPPALDKPALLRAISGHILATAELVGLYERK